jgi:hypothetical protein
MPPCAPDCQEPQAMRFDILLDYAIHRMPWHIRRALDQVHEHCANLFLHVASFLGRGVVVPDKALSFHAQAVSGCNKGQAAHGLAFGRAFQLGRMGGLSSWSVPVRRSGWKTKPPYAR